MKFKIIGAIVVIVGVLLGVVMVIRGIQKDTPAEPITSPAIVPYQHVISGVGIIESSSENIFIATHLSGVVEAVYVKEGEHVKKGDPLFLIDLHDLIAERALREAGMKAALANVKIAQAELAEKRTLYALVQSVTDKRAVSIEEIDRRREAVRIAEARVNLMKAEVERAKAQIESVEVNIEKSTVRSPIDGEVLQVNIQTGEYAQTGETRDPLILLGDTDILNVRADIDETDAWRFNAGSSAFAVLRGNPNIRIPLTFDHIEPYVRPKKSLTGQTSERIDTRVLQVLYSFDPEGYPVYVGQLVDVYIEETNSFHENGVN